MLEKTYAAPQGLIHYWTNSPVPDRPTLVFLPGLTADHRLFDRQIETFGAQYHVLVWDAPGHSASRPFPLDFSLMDKAAWLHGILEEEGIRRPVLIGQSMGGYVAQCFFERYPGKAGGFVSIDSAPLKRKYMTAAVIWLLKHTGLIYRSYPWGALVNSGAKGCATTAYGQALMREMITSYAKADYCALTSYGFRILGEAIEADRPYQIDCPAMLLCGKQDRAGLTKRYNRRWAAGEGIPLHWIENAGHNANTDRPELVNQRISTFLGRLELTR